MIRGNIKVYPEAIAVALAATLYLEDAILELVDTTEDTVLVEWFGIEDETEARQLLQTTFRHGVGDAIPIAVRAT